MKQLVVILLLMIEFASAVIANVAELIVKTIGLLSRMARRIEAFAAKRRQGIEQPVTQEACNTNGT